MVDDQTYAPFHVMDHPPWVAPYEAEERWPAGEFRA
jgi:hypothetical protein